MVNGERLTTALTEASEGQPSPFETEIPGAISDVNRFALNLLNDRTLLQAPRAETSNYQSALGSLPVLELLDPSVVRIALRQPLGGPGQDPSYDEGPGSDKQYEPIDPRDERQRQPDKWKQWLHF